MKKLVSLILLTFVLVAFSGCTAKDGLPNNDRSYFPGSPYEDLYGP